VNVLCVIHGSSVRSGVFGDVVSELGHTLEEWSLAWGTAPPRPIDDYSAVIVLGGAMHADQDHLHPWLREENLFIQRLLDLHVPLLGVCLGAQLIAKATHAAVLVAPEPEIGWFEVELTPAAADDPVLSRLPSRFDAFQWHFYTYELPAGSQELARSRVCTQAFRLGDAAWGVQFHAEVTRAQIAGWLEESPEELPTAPARFLEETDARIERWNELGRTLCRGFVEVAEHASLAA
jgi:GMP synthase-like glutamine amidotransferase